MKDKEKKEKAQKGEEKSTVWTVIGIVLCLILLPILVINSIMIVKGLINPSKVPTVGGYAPLIVLTDSMYPEIESGDLIIVRSIEPEDVKVGDILSFFDPDSKSMSVLTHRCIEIVEDENGLAFRTRGDANNADDKNPAPADSLIGVYVTKIDGAGDVAMFLQSTPGLVVCVAVPLALLVAFELIRRRKYEKAKDSDTQALLAELEALRAKAEAKPEPKTETNPETKPEAKPQEKPEEKPEAKPEAEPEEKSEAKPEEKSEG